MIPQDDLTPYGYIDRVLECTAATLRGKKSKIGEVLCEVQTVECLVCNEGAEDLGAPD